jgi:hypothetical protein
MVVKEEKSQCYKLDNLGIASVPVAKVASTRP